jgi:uncharacterized protein (UPF0261 family)
MSKTILLIGTLDTKGAEFAYVRDLIHARGHKTLLVNVGIFPPTITPYIDADTLARGAGESLTALRAAGDRSRALAAMTLGAVSILSSRYRDGYLHFDAVLGLGGSGGTAIATAVMRALPIGVPKLMVSTLASGDIAPYVDISDITMMYSVVDIAGLNAISRRILANAAGMIVGAAEQSVPDAPTRPLIAATMFGVTTPCVMRVRERLDAAGYDVLIFHATGSGGRAMESLIAGGHIAGAADITTTEWADQLVGGVLAAGEARLDAGARAGIPQVVSVGALDMVNFWARETVPAHFAGRTFHAHNANVTLMRTTPEECAELGRIIAEKLNNATAPVTIFLPMRGISALDAEGQPFGSPEADAALFKSLRRHLINHRVAVVPLDLHINDPAFADALADRLLEMLKT